MIALIRTELLKVRTTRMALGFAIGTLGLVLLSVSVTIFTAGKAGTGPSLDTLAGVRSVFASATAATTAALLLGIIFMASEFRHGTATPTFLVTPRRGQVVGAKLLASAIVGLALGLVDAVFTALIAVPWLAAKDVSVPIGTVLPVLGGAVLAAALMGAVGVGVGALIRNQVVAIVVALAWTFVIEALLLSLLPAVGKWLPGGATSGITNTTVQGHHLLPVWAAALVLIAYAVVFAAAGSRFVLRRDIG